MPEDRHRFTSAEDALEARREKCYQRLGTRKPRCACGETDPFALTGQYPNIHCYECANKAAGRNPIEKHHVIGRHNDPDLIATMPGNAHRILSEMQNVTWPQETLRNPDGSPLLKASAAIRSFLDHLRVLIEYVLGWVPPFLEGLHEWLVATYGDQYWLSWNWPGAMP